MKRLLTSLILALSLPVAAYGAVAASTWQASISTLASTMNSHSFNVQYTVLSTQADSFSVVLLESFNGGAYNQCGTTQDTSADSNDVNGGSGSFPACVPSDGEYSFKFQVTRDGTSGSDSQLTTTTSTHVDTVAPPAPVYKGKTQTGNNYVVNFAAPNSNDVVKIEIFASTSKTYTADSSTFVGQETGVTPNQNFSFSYTAPDSTPRYFSVQSFDAAGNGSALVGDPGTVVHPTVFTNLNGNGVPSVAAAQEAAATSPAGQVQGANTPGNGQINAPGQSSTSKNNGKVLGTATAKHNSHVWWYVWGGVLVALILAGYWLLVRRNKTGE